MNKSEEDLRDEFEESMNLLIENYGYKREEFNEMVEDTLINASIE